ncbi:MAG: hypothetical protein ACI4MM_11425 [Candidatus Ventricola sp.]
MMKRTGLFFLLLACLLWSGMAGAQTLPSNEVFSPGLVKLAAMEMEQPNVWAQASVQVDKAMYARDLSVLSAMLGGTTLTYQSGDAGETLSIERDGEAMGVYVVPESGTLDALESRLLGTAVLERVPLAGIADWLEGLQAGDALGFGFAVSEPFTLVRTMSDDGTRLTKINVSGAIAREGEAAYRVEGFLRQPAGRSPKDTFELTFTQDEDNFIELAYSALRENEITRKDKEGTASVRTALKAAGKLAGSGISSRLTVTMKNRWTADGDALSERISITASLTHEDKTPGRRMQRLNSVAAETKNTICLTTHESGDEVLSLTDAMEIEVTLDENTFFAGSADLTVHVGGDAQLLALEPEPITPQAIQNLARRIYPQLDEDTQAAIRKGL